MCHICHAHAHAKLLGLNNLNRSLSHAKSWPKFVKIFFYSRIQLLSMPNYLYELFFSTERCHFTIKFCFLNCRAPTPRPLRDEKAYKV